MSAPATVAEAEARLARLSERSDRAALRLFAGAVRSPAYAQQLARQVEEAQADVDLLRARSARAVPPAGALPPVVGVAEIAGYFGVSRQLAYKWTRTHGDFPAPVAELAMGNVWNTADVLAYGERRGRERGAGPRAAGRQQ